MASFPDNYVDDGWIWCYYDVTDTASPTTLVASATSLNQFDSSFEIDGVSVAKAQTYQFSTTGEHLVKMKKSGALLNGSFSAVATLKRVYLPSVITELTGSGYGGPFYNCTGLTHVQLPSSLTSIGTSSFKGCSSLQVVNLDGHTGITAVGQEAFNGCSNMAVDVELPNLTSISGAAFNSSGITKVLDLGTVTSLSNISSSGAFKGCANLTEVVLPSTVTNIGAYAFRDCTNLADINLVHEGITTIGQEAFRNCSKMEVEVDLPNLSSLGGSAFTSSGITKIINLGAITALTNVSSAGQFSSCTKLIEANLPSTLTTIGVAAFSGCSALVTLNISKNADITSIGQDAFRGCSSLLRIVLPVSLTSINGWAFASCSGLKEMVCYAITPPTLSNNPLGGLTGIQKIYVNPQSVDTYKSTTGWSSFSNKIFPLWDETPIAINHLSLGDFRRRIMMGISTQEVPYPDNYVDDGWIWAYYEVTDTENPTELLYASFNYITDFGANFIIDGETVARTKTYTFSTTGEHLVKMQRSGSIRANAFRVNALKRIYICNTVTSLGDNCFYSSPNLTHIWLPDTITSIANQSFSYCISLYRVNLDNTKITTVQGSNNYGLFRGSTSLKKIKLPTTVTAINGRAFQSCSSLDYVNIEELTSLASIATLAFSATKIKGKIVFPSSLTSIVNQAFQSCLELEEVDLGNTQLTTISGSTNYGCFGSCSNLKKAILPATLTTIQSRAFYQCYKLETIVCYATTPPSLGTQSLPGTSYVQHIYVPAESVDTYKSASGWSSYAANIEAIPTT